MKLVIKKYNELTIDELYEMLRSRAEVFVVEQNCVYQDLDGIDQDAIHIFYEENGRVVAYSRIFPDAKRSSYLRMGRVLTLEHGKGLGGKLLKESIRCAKMQEGMKYLYIEAQCYAVGFYDREGFVVCTDEFLEDGIPHVGMILDLE